ncbi:MAG: catalase [Planctomycetes bacterium]|nr:catalase [Planctomycetota bacterium]
MISSLSGGGSSINGFLSALGASGGKGTDAARKSPEAGAPQTQSLGKSELTEEERKQVDELKKRDAEVRQHEQAHKSAAGGFAKGGPSFSYQRGPDGRQYAVGGEVQIDTSPVKGDPEATVRKMRQIQRAANAPAEPSSQDRKVAARAAGQMQAAQREKTAERTEEAPGSDSAQASGSFQSDQASSAAGAGANSKVANDATAKAASELLGKIALQENSQPGRFIDVAI